MRKFFLLIIAFFAQPALAHPGEHHGTLFDRIWHWLSAPDHLALLVLVLVVGASSVVLAQRRATRPIRNEHHDSR